MVFMLRVRLLEEMGAEPLNGNRFDVSERSIGCRSNRTEKPGMGGIYRFIRSKNNESGSEDCSATDRSVFWRCKR